jgi:6-pyruvoyltetrahydropterin/6-carboxytetrahydropterin synthase
MLITTRRLHFDAAHRVIGHENKCKYLHGHRFVVEASFIAQSIDNVGRIIDFGAIKHILGSWIEKNWDHNVILSKADEALGNQITSITKQNIYYLPCNPTAENLAYHLMQEICPALFKQHNVKCKKIKLYETPNCFAENDDTQDADEL